MSRIKLKKSICLIRSLFLIIALSFLHLPSFAEEVLKSREIFESKTLSIWYYKYPNTNYPDEFGTYKYFWIGFQVRGKHSDPECVFKESQIVAKLNFSFKNLNKSTSFVKNCPNIAVTGDSGIDLTKYFSEAELDEISKHPELLKLSVSDLRIVKIDNLSK